MKNKTLKKFFVCFFSAVMSFYLYSTPILAGTIEESAIEDVQMELETYEHMPNDNIASDTATELSKEEENVSYVDLPISGKSGDLDWKIDEDGTLTISGSGDYKCYPYNVSPKWCEYERQIKKAVVKANNITNTAFMFSGCSNLTSIDLSSFNTENVTDMSYMFDGCKNLTSIDLSSFNTENVTDMSYMFCNCIGLTSMDLSSFNTKNVKDMFNMFSGCSNLASIDLSSFNTKNVKDMSYMFFYCLGLTNIDLGSFNTENVTDMSFMFYNCNNLTNIDLSNFNAENVTTMSSMFDNCIDLTTLKVPKNIKSDMNLPDHGTWKDENGTLCTQVTKNLSTTMTYTKVSDAKVASYQGNNFYQSDNGKMRCYDANGNMIKNSFRCDGTYTYYFQNDGTAMTDCLTYHPDGKHVIYFDENGHEVFNNFTHVKKSISGDAVDDLCFFDVYGYMYVDFITYDQAGVNLYYANPYGVMEHNGWFQFSDGNIGYANADGTLMTNQFSYDQFGRKVYFQGDGKLARGLISDGTTYYQMDETDGHCTGEFLAQ